MVAGDICPVFKFACSSSAGGGMSQKELRRLYGYTNILEGCTGTTKTPFTNNFQSLVGTGPCSPSPGPLE